MSEWYSEKLPAGSLRYQKKVRARVVAAEAPHVPFGPALEHGAGAAAHVVDVVDLPGGVR
jgi:hypothetical protein